MESFGPEIFGLGLAEPGSDGTVYLRMDDRHHRIAVHPGSPSGFDIEFGAGGERLGDDFVQVNPSHSEVRGHKPVVKSWAPTVKPGPA
jgi:hypothetical protein